MTMHRRARNEGGRYTKDPDTASAEVFWAKTTPEPNTGCWLWTGVRGKYGNVSVGNRTVSAHRRAWQLANGPIPEGAWVLHRCDLPGCVNPSHLFLGTPRDNSRDMVRKGRSLRGEAHPSAKLSTEDVRRARAAAASGVSVRKLAPRLGVSPTTVWQAATGKTWRQN